MKLLLPIFLMVISISLFGQSSSWTSWEKLYADKQIRVEIQFKIRENGCQTQKRSKYRYRLTGNLYKSTKYVYWKMKYKNCGGQTIEAQQQFRISIDNYNDPTARNGELMESMDYTFMTKQVVKKFYAVSDKQQTQAKKKEQPKSSTKPKTTNRTHQPNRNNRQNRHTLSRGRTSPLVIKLGIGAHSDIGLTQNITAETFDNMQDWDYYPYATFGIFFKLNRWHQRHPRNHLLGLIMSGEFLSHPDMNNNETITAQTYEVGMYFWETLRLSAGMWALQSEYRLLIPPKISLTTGVTLKVHRNFQIDLNHIALRGRNARQWSSRIQMGIQFSGNIIN